MKIRTKNWVITVDQPKVKFKYMKSLLIFQICQKLIVRCMILFFVFFLFLNYSRKKMSVGKCQKIVSQLESMLPDAQLIYSGNKNSINRMKKG